MNFSDLDTIADLAPKAHPSPTAKGDLDDAVAIRSPRPIAIRGDFETPSRSRAPTAPADGPDRQSRPVPAVTDLFDDRPMVSPPRPPTPMTHHPIALNGNLISQETGASMSFSCRIDYFTRGELPAATTVPQFFTDDYGKVAIFTSLLRANQRTTI